jgi:hypothetical protein
VAGERKEVIRIFLIFVGGSLISIVASAVLEYFFVRDSGTLISKLYTGLPADQRAQFYQRLQHSITVSVYIVGPAVGVMVGIFVALLPRTWTRIVAMCCLIPDFMFVLLDDQRRPWAYSVSGIATFAFDHALPFVAAALTAGVLRNVLTSRADDNRATPM